MYLAQQVYPEDSLGLYNAYLDATQRPLGYLILDLTQYTNDGRRFRNNIFPEACEIELPNPSRAQDSRTEIA